MNKTELIDMIAEKAELTKVAASAALDALLEGVMEVIEKWRSCCISWTLVLLL